MSDPRLARIRNFCIVAHIDHGKSTLADRLLEITRTLTPQQMKAQVLDDMDLEREKGITIKSHAIAMEYEAKDGETYQFNLIDTPGHVDFTYEVSRSLAACEGAVLVVDASQGIEAQTLSNFFLAREQGLAVVGAVNKIDLPSARVEDVALEMEHACGVPAEGVLRMSAKTGVGVHELLPGIGKLGAQVGLSLGASWNPYDVGQGLVGAAFVDLPILRAPGGKLSYELLVSLSDAESGPFTITFVSVVPAIQTRAP